MPKTIILSLGGSLIVPNKVDIAFLTNFKRTIEKYTEKNFKFIIYCGGGRLARNMQKAASKITQVSNDDLDWIGIYATRLNAMLLRMIFKDKAEEKIIMNPNERIKFKKAILIAAGWIPGWSTDYDAVLLAKNLGINQIVNMSNVDYLYDKDPKINKKAKPISSIGWDQYLKVVDLKWKAGMNSPFDPIAAMEAKKLGIKVCIIGKEMANFEALLDGKRFTGTGIE